MTPFLPRASFRRPQGWLMTMDWEDLLFMHWPMDPEALRPLIPAGLELDLFGREAWISIVPFRMSGTRPRFLPGLPGVSRFPELNVRTYVSRGGVGGVWFFSLDAGSPLAVRGARRFFHLPYFDADMAIDRQDGEILYASRRTHRGAPPADLHMRYSPSGPVYRASAGTLEDWLTARYCLYSADIRGRIYRCDIHHKPWRLRPAVARVSRNTMTSPVGLILPRADPLLQFAEKTEVVAWWPQALD